MKKNFFRIGAAFFAVLLVLGTASCSKKEKKIRVGFTVQDLTNTYFASVVRGINDHKDQYNIELVLHDGKSDASNQVNGIENFITQGLDAIVICPIDPVAPALVVKEAQEAGIPVISWSELVEGSSAFLTLKQHQYGFTAGTIAGEWAAEKFPNQADAKVMFVYVPEVAALAERGQGLKDGFLQLVPGATIVAEQAGNTPEAGQNAVETVLVKNPDLNVIVACNDAVALGAYEAMAAAGKKVGEVAIVGLDASAEAIAKIRENTMFIGTVDIGAYAQGELFCKTALKVISEGKLNEPIYVDFIPVTQANISNY
ncbi:MAG: D-ribose ABC transporter substrate-binding protein [Termitinemataceae bacterium]|nr:MAG: D-ribose ABC transporter substrate-binding protein [Termitinemataceae bacterium]